ncbi:MAG: hypothetical protein JKY81_02325 [Colwellia sp.]|nr:hypothetical protein [Colwellia sp.]
MADELNTPELFEEETPVEVGFELYEEEALKLPSDNRRKNDALDVSIQSSGVGEDPRPIFESMMSSQSYDADDRASRILDNISNTVTSEEERIQNQMSEGFPVDPQAEAQLFQSIVDTSQGQLAESRTYVMSNPSSKFLSEDQKEDAAFLHYLKGMAAKVMDEATYLELASDFASQVLLPQENFRVQEIAEVLGADFKGMDLVDTTDFYGRLTNQMLSEEPEQRVKLIEHVINSWPEIKGNNRLALVSFLNDISGDYNEDIKRAENAIERLDQATLGFGLGKIIKGALKASNGLRMASKLNNLEAVSDIVEAGSKGELSDIGVTPLDAVGSIDPMDSVNQLNKGADNSVAEGIRQIQGQNRIFLDEIDEVNNFGLALNSVEKNASRERAIHGLEEQPGISNVTVTPTNEREFKLSYEIRDAQGNLTGKATQTRLYLQTDVGEFISDGTVGYTGVDLGVTSPKLRFNADGRTLVQLPEQMILQSAKIKKLYDSAIRNTLGPLNSKEMSKVNDLLQAGDEFTDDIGNMVGKEFTFEEAVGSGRATAKEFEAYQGVRQVVEHMYWAKNKEVIDEWKVKGVKLADWDGVRLPVKSYRTPSDAKQGFLQSSTKSHHVVIDGGEDVKQIKPYGGPGELTDDFLEEMYAKGYTLNKVDGQGLFANGNTNVEWAFLKGDSLREPSGMVLNRREGYMPKIRKDAHYFVKERVAVNIGGASVEQLKTVRYFDNNIDAQKYLDDIDPDRETYSVIADRELSSSDLNNEYINVSGGLFTGSRKSTDIPFGLPGDVGERVDALGSLQRYISNIARNMPLSLYRIGTQQRWLNHAKELGALPGGYKGGFSRAAEELIETDSTKFLKDSHNQIGFISGIPSKAEKEMAERQRNFSKSLEKFPVFGRPLARRLNNTSINNMSGAARGLTFHMMLGMYNPAQFAIQASGSFVALSINPIHGAKAIGTAMGASIADLAIGTPAKLKALKKSLGDKGLLDVEAYDAWDKSGMREAVTHSNLDYHSLWNDAPYDAGILRKVLGNGDMFFRQGELVNSRISFFTAFNRWKDLNKGKTPDDNDLSDIIGRAEEYRLNMSRANSAKFQTGLRSVPTQFQQVNTKFFEKLVGKDFTGAEKARLIGGQTALFGAAGIPLIGALAPHLLDAVGVDATNTDSEALQAMQNGVLGWLIQDQFDINSVITGRMTLGQDFIENLVASTVEPMVLSDVALGPFGEVWARTLGTQGIAQKWMTTFSTIAYADEVEIEDLAAVGKVLAKSLAQFPSSTANLVKAYDMTHSKFYKNRKGKAIFEWADMNTSTIVAQSLGFSPQEVTDWYELNNRDGGMIPGQVKNVEAGRITWLMNEMANESDETQQRFLGMAINSIKSKYARQSDRVALISQVKANLKKPVNAWDKQMRKALEDFQSEAQEGLAAIHNHSKLRTSPKIARELEKAGVK